MDIFLYNKIMGVINELENQTLGDYYLEGYIDVELLKERILDLR